MMWMAVQVILSLLTWCFILFVAPVFIFFVIKLIERLRDFPVSKKEKRREIDLH